MDFSIVEKNKFKTIFDVVSSKLFTPYGLRTLEETDFRYKGKYFGNRTNRDQAYHNGTIWPWLLGPFITAYFKMKKIENTTIDIISKNILQSILNTHLLTSGLGYVSEIFDGDFPHEPRGCIAQAWSIAEPLRTYVEDLMNVKPELLEILY